MKDVPLDIIQRLRSMTKPQAATVLDAFDLDEETRERYMRVAAKNLPEHAAEAPPLNTVTASDYYLRMKHADPHRRGWWAAAFMLGASYRMLGKLHDVAHQTVKQSIDRVLSDDDKAHRLGFMLEPERISEYHVAYYKNVQMLSVLPPARAAQWLKENVTPDALDIDTRYEPEAQ